MKKMKKLKNILSRMNWMKMTTRMNWTKTMTRSSLTRMTRTQSLIASCVFQQVSLLHVLSSELTRIFPVQGHVHGHLCHPN